MVISTLKYFSGPGVPRYVLFTVGYTWFCSLSIIILVPADIWTTKLDIGNGAISFFWSWSYWSTFFLTWSVVPLIQGFEDAGDFTVTERLRTSVHTNLVFYLIVGSIGLFGLILLIMMHKIQSDGVLGFAMACSNTFGLVTGTFLLGFGLTEIPRTLWRNADWTIRQKVLSHKIAKMAVKLDDAHQDLSNAIVVAQATSNQISKRDPLRPYMDVIDSMLDEMFREDPLFKPQGGRLGENDMDYDTDEKSMATLRRHLRRAREEYYRYRSEYMTYVLEALELEDTVKNYGRGSSTGWKYVSCFRPARKGNLGILFDTVEFFWRCIFRKQLDKALAVILGTMSAAILVAEATLLPTGVDLSLFSILINYVGEKEVLVQVLAFVPLMYMCICTYYSLFKVGMLMFYSLTPSQTSSVSLLMICSMVARYAPPVSYNFLNLINLGGKETVFEKRMGKIDDAVPFFGNGFNRIYPLIIVIYTLLIASNFFDRLVGLFGCWKKLTFQSDTDDADGFNPSGVIILQKEWSWIEQGQKIGDHVIPLARNFGGVDDESGVHNTAAPQFLIQTEVAPTYELNGRTDTNISSKSSYPFTNIEVIRNKYVTPKQQNRNADIISVEKNFTSTKVVLHDTDKSPSSSTTRGSPSGLALKWQSMKNSFQNFKENIGSRRFLPVREIQEMGHVPHVSSSESLDEIFQRLKRKSADQSDNDIYD